MFFGCHFSEAGKYASTAQDSNCTSCGPGSYTNRRIGSTICSDCSPGTSSPGQVANCSVCVPGKYSGSRASECARCSEGTAQPLPAQSSCLACEAGKFGNASAHKDMTACESCPAGQSSSSRSGRCTSCSKGFHSLTNGTANCRACAGGRFASFEGTIECSFCPPGRQQPATGQPSCFPCEAGKHAAEAGALGCTTCAVGRASVAGAATCDRCAKGHFLAATEASGEAECQGCPENMNCAGALQMPRPEPGFWTDLATSRADPSYIAEVYQCPRDTCVRRQSQWSEESDDEVTLNARRLTRLLEEDEEGQGAYDLCWSLLVTNSSTDGDDSGASAAQGEECDPSRLQCRRGSSGPLCGGCADQFQYSTSLRRCVECSDSATWYEAFGIVSQKIRGW